LRSAIARLIKSNLALLLVVAFLPFPTRLLTELIRDPQAERLAAVFYGLRLLLISVTQACIWRYVSANHRLLPDDVSQFRVDHITRISGQHRALCIRHHARPGRAADPRRPVSHHRRGRFHPHRIAKV
jgi:hypothetical protein